jgi:prepilin-type N-terminal cleavage/methylation domain-containing protein
MPSTKQDQSGFTLIEMLIGVLIMAMITLGIATAANISMRSQTFAEDQINSIREARQCLPVIIAEIKYCSSITAIGANNSQLSYLDADGLACRIYRDSDSGLIKLTRNLVTKNISTTAVDQLVFVFNDSLSSTIQVQIDVYGQSLTTTVRTMNYSP